MYYEEKIINGILSWRNNPHDDFTPFTIEELSHKVVELQETITVYTYRMNGCISLLDGTAELKD